MKKNISTISMFLMVLMLLCACADTPNNLSDMPLNQHLITKSIELTCTMDSLAQSDEYMMLISVQPELNDIIAKIGNDEYKAPNKAVIIKVSDEAIGSIIWGNIGELNLPDDAYEMVVARMYSSVPSMINAQQGVTTLAATSVISVGKAFQQHRDFSNNTYVVLIYDNYSSVTVFIKSGEGTISASTTFLFLPDDIKRTVTEETAADYLSQEFNISGIEIEYIDGEKIAEYK